MTRAWVRTAAFGAALALSAPASATRWVQYDRWNWVDTDSVLRVGGGLVSYRTYHGSDAPGDEGGHPEGVDCAAQRWYWMDKGQLVPVPDEPDLEPYASEDHPLFRMLCR